MLKIEKVLVGIWSCICIFEAALYDPVMFVNMQHIDKYFFGPTTIDNLMKIDMVNLFLYFVPMVIGALGIGLYGFYKLFKNIQAKS